MQKILINITDIYVEETDSVTVYDSSEDADIAENEENEDLTLAYSSGNAVSLKFVSDYDNEFNGFKFHFEFFGKYVVVNI